MNYLRRSLKWGMKLMCCVCLIISFMFLSTSLNQKPSPKRSLLVLNYLEQLPGKYIFDIRHWRSLLDADQQLLDRNTDNWCDIPDQLQSIATALCQIYWRKNCGRLPCHMVYSDKQHLETVQCLRGGQKVSSGQARPDSVCYKSYALDLFLNQSNNATTYPSIIADSLMPFSDALYIDILNKNFRNSTSAWGFYFNFESITNYPWAADRKTLELFDITFGYDRQLYDVVPIPWLFNYVDRLIPGGKRLSMKQVMQQKKPIRSKTGSNYDWLNDAKDSTSKLHNDRFFVTAPILWMNSNCHTPTKRTEFMTELMQYIEVDNFGTCGSNRQVLPWYIVNVQGSRNKNIKDRGSYKWEDGKVALSSEYLFTIAIENSINHDYITEKLWHALIAGSVPIYLGAPNIEEWLPCWSDCIIDLRKFTSAKDAAMYIQKVATDRMLYESYHQWRREPMPQHFRKLLNYFNIVQKYNLDCVVCDMSHRAAQGENLKDMKNQLIHQIGHF